MLYENLRRISVSDGVLISTATLENCFIPISRLLHFGIEKIGTARHLKRAPWQQVHPYHHSDVPYQEATLKYLCSGTGSMLKSVGCDTSSLQKQGRGGKSVQLPFRITVNWFLLILRESVPFEHAIVNTLKISKDQFTRSPNQSRRGDATCHMWGVAGNSAK